MAIQIPDTHPACQVRERAAKNDTESQQANVDVYKEETQDAEDAIPRFQGTERHRACGLVISLTTASLSFFGSALFARRLNPRARGVE